MAKQNKSWEDEVESAGYDFYCETDEDISRKECVRIFAAGARWQRERSLTALRLARSAILQYELFNSKFLECDHIEWEPNTTMNYMKCMNCGAHQRSVEALKEINRLLGEK